MTLPAGVVRGVRVAVLVFVALMIAFFAYAVEERARFPAELEWMSGGMLDTVERVLQGKPIYAEPSADWIPYLYPPLYYWMAAALAHVLSIVTACRVLSVIATVVASALVFRMARVLGGTRFWATVGVGFFYGCYSLSDYWYDIERSDSLCVALLLGGVLVAVESRAIAGAVIAGALLGLSFFAKQPGLLVCVGTCAGLAVSGQWKRALAAAAGAACVIVPLGVWLHVTTHGWFEFYCLTMGARHGIDPTLLTVFFVVDLSNAFFLTAATFTILGWLGRDLFLRARSRTRAADDAPLVVFGSALAAAFASSAMSRLHVGGYFNVLLFWTSLACVAGPVIAARIEKGAHDTPLANLAAAGLALGALLQLSHFSYDPNEAAPDRQRVIDAGIVEAKMRDLEKDGEVLLTGRGHVTAHRHFHLAALIDVMRGGYGIPQDLLRGLDERKYAAYVVDEWSELTLEGILNGRRSELGDHVLANYYVAERFDDRERNPVVGWIAHPSWVMKPRKRPLVGRTHEDLDRRRMIEAGLAEARMRQKQAGAHAANADSIEDLAESVLRENDQAQQTQQTQ